MRMLIGVLILSLLFPFSVSQAETGSLYANSSRILPNSPLKNQNVNVTQDLGIVVVTPQIPEYELVARGIARPLTGYRPGWDRQVTGFFESGTEAFILSGQRGSMAFRLQGRPLGRLAEPAVAGELTRTRPGLIPLGRVSDMWLLPGESWPTGKKQGLGDKVRVVLFRPISDVDQYMHSRVKGALAGISPDHLYRKGTLHLTQVNNNRRKKAFMFIFLMNNDKVSDVAQPAVLDAEHRPRMHVLASKKVITEQISIKDAVMMDITVAKYADGYSPEEWNLVLPGGKPREVTVSWLWAF